LFDLARHRTGVLRTVVLCFRARSALYASGGMPRERASPSHSPREHITKNTPLENTSEIRSNAVGARNTRKGALPEKALLWETRSFFVPPKLLLNCDVFSTVVMYFRTECKNERHP